MSQKTISRRDFLKAAVAGTATLGLMGLGISARPTACLSVWRLRSDVSAANLLRNI